MRQLQCSWLAVAGLMLAPAISLRGEEPAWPQWNQYQVIMWSTGTPRDFNTWIERLRELNFTAEQSLFGRDPAPYVKAGFGFYVENMVSELAHLHDRKPLYDADYQGYITTRDRKYLTRKPCFHDEEWWWSVRARVQPRVTPYAGQGALAYDLRDELSIGSYANPMDYCHSPHTLAAFREWLQNVYGSLEALNAEWETDYADWDKVIPWTTWEIKDRERAALAARRPENYAPWADHREFMDLTFARALDRLREIVRQADPSAPVGVEGTQMPSAWGGFDLWRLSQAVDWIEPYDIASSREILRSFLPEGTPVLSTVFGSDFPRLRHKLWHLLLRGDRGAIVWDDEQSRMIEKEKEGLPITDRGWGLQPILAEIREGARIVFPLRRQPARIAIHYSQASIRAHWMFDSREDRDTWPRRFSSYEAVHSRVARVRDSFARVIQDLGLAYNYVSYEQLENGELEQKGYRVLLLPQSVAMSEKESAAVERFVEAGGLVIADNMAATMDEHCRRRSRGRLDDLFGIERKELGWRGRPAGGALESPDERYAPLLGFDPDLTVVDGESRQTSAGTPVIVDRRVGEGRAVYLNLGMHDYGKYRLEPPKGENFRALFERLLAGSGMEAEVRVVEAETGRPAPCVEVTRFRGEDGEYVALLRNPEPRADSLKAAGYPTNDAIETPLAIRVLLAREAEVTEVLSGDRRAAAREWEGVLEPWRPLILRLGE